jgi:hypothetical protein
MPGFGRIGVGEYEKLAAEASVNHDLLRIDWVIIVEIGILEICGGPNQTHQSDYDVACRHARRNVDENVLTTEAHVCPSPTTGLASTDARSPLSIFRDSSRR